MDKNPRNLPTDDDDDDDTLLNDLLDLVAPEVSDVL